MRLNICIACSSLFCIAFNVCSKMVINSEMTEAVKNKYKIERKLNEVETWNIGTKGIHVNNPHVAKENRRHLEDLHEQ